MDFSEDWKSIWPVSSVFSPPLLLHNSNEGESSKRSRSEKHPIGPLIFNPCRETLTPLLKSLSLAPLLPPPYSDVLLRRSILSSSTTINYSTASKIASEFGPQVSDCIHDFNALQLLRCPNLKADDDTTTTSVLAFFPTGDNYDQLGFAMLCFSDSKLSLKRFVDGRYFCVHSHRLNHRILRLLVNPVVDFDKFYSLASFGNGSYSSSNYTCIGYIMVSTMYSVHWYTVKMHKGEGSIVLDCVGNADVKLFQGSAVVHPCWSPHLSEECVVLLENGKMFLFDVTQWLKNGRLLKAGGKKLCVPWDGLDENGRWLSCEFSWHPRILVVAHSSAVFLVDLRFDKTEVCTLLKAEFLSVGKLDTFVALSRSDSSRFCFAAATNRLLLLCDVRRPLMPVLQWAHSLQNPEYVAVFRLSELRPTVEDGKYKWASESGHCILLGSFWHCEFSLFCYGPDNEREPLLSEISTVCNSFYSWGLPSEISLSGRDCFCGSCLVRGDFWQDHLPNWIDWKKKKEIVLGFGILDSDLHVQWDNRDKCVGFSLIRLMSSGKLEAQRYSAAWEFDTFLDEAHKGLNLSIEDNFLYHVDSSEIELSMKHKYLKIDFIKEYLNGNLEKVVTKRQIELQQHAEEFQLKFHKKICDEMKKCGVSALRSPQVSLILKDVNFPTSFHEIALKTIWAGLSMNLLSLAFCASKQPSTLQKKKRNDSNPDDKNLPFPFRKALSLPGNTSEKLEFSNALAGPLLPTPFLLVLRNQELKERVILPVVDELRLNCDKVMESARSFSDPDSGNTCSLANDTDEMPSTPEDPNLLGIHRPTFSSTGKSEHTRHEAFVYQKRQEPEKAVTGVELFNEGCPVQLKFDVCDLELSQKELDLFQQLKRHHLNFQKGFQPYQDFLINSHRFS